LEGDIDMANYMAEVAKILGVERGEIFEIKGYQSEYVFINDGLIDATSGFLCDGTLWKLLTGEATIRRQPWKPKDGEEYWLIDIDLNDYYVCSDVYHSWCAACVNFYKIGNCYRTKEEAEANRDKWAAFYESDEVLEV
jgi:hypothetical protein